MDRCAAAGLGQFPAERRRIVRQLHLGHCGRGGVDLLLAGAQARQGLLGILERRQARSRSSFREALRLVGRSGDPLAALQFAQPQFGAANDPPQPLDFRGEVSLRLVGSRTFHFQQGNRLGRFAGEFVLAALDGERGARFQILDARDQLLVLLTSCSFCAIAMATARRAAAIASAQSRICWRKMTSALRSTDLLCGFVGMTPHERK